MTTFNFQQDLISEIFGERPELAFLGNLGQRNLPRSMEDFFRGQTSNFLQQFQQQVGQQLVGGNLPTLTPQDFFGPSNLDFQQRFRDFSPLQRGLGTNQSAPRPRFLF